MTNESNQNIQESEQSSSQTATDFKVYRQRAVKRYGFRGFCRTYLRHHFDKEPADFHREMMNNVADDSIKRLEITGFRGSAKSTITSLAYILYAALEKPELYPFILSISDTGTQASISIANIKQELENNEAIKEDYGITPKATIRNPNPNPTLESEEEWQSKNLLLSNGVRILARSRGQKVRGLKHRQHRPALAVIDDPEDLEWINSKENRDKTERWLRGEVIPALNENGRVIVVGNYLHDDAIMARIKRWGSFKTLEYPLLRNGICAWPAKYPTEESLRKLQADVGIVSWSREYLLKVVPEEGQIIKEVFYYDEIPVINQGVTGHGVDLAISNKASADYTAIVSGTICYDENDGLKARVYIRPNPFHKKGCGLQELVNECIRLAGTGNKYHKFFPEKVGYQQAAIEFMEKQGLSVEPAIPFKDKRARLQTVAPLIKNATVLFPRHGCEDLISEVLNFGVESHDDLVDALGYLILKLMENGLRLPEVAWADW